MKKRTLLIAIMLILLLGSIMTLNFTRGSFDYDDPVKPWLQLAMIALIAHTTFSFFMPKRYRIIKLIPAFFIVGFMVSFLVSHFPDPNLENPFGILSMVYAAILVTALMYLIDLLSPTYHGFKVFIGVALLAVVVYGNFNTAYYSFHFVPPTSVEEFIGYFIITHFAFYGFYWIMLLTFIYQMKVVPERQKEVLPYNRYRPQEVDPKLQKNNQATKSNVTIKTPEQLNRERNAIKSLTALKEAGLLSDEEFERKKNKVLSGK